MTKTRMIGMFRRRVCGLALDHEAARRQQVADAVAQLALQLDAAVYDGAAGAAGPLQVLTELFQEGGVVRQAVDNRHGLATAALLLHAQLRGDARRDRLLAAGAAAAA